MYLVKKRVLVFPQKYVVQSRALEIKGIITFYIFCYFPRFPVKNYNYRVINSFGVSLSQKTNVKKFRKTKNFLGGMKLKKFICRTLFLPACTRCFRVTPFYPIRILSGQIWKFERGVVQKFWGVHRGVMLNVENYYIKE